MENSGNGAGIYKLATSFLLGVVLTGIGTYFSTQKDLITRREFMEQGDRFEKHLEANDRQIGSLAEAQEKNAMNIGVLIEDFKIGDGVVRRPRP